MTTRRAMQRFLWMGLVSSSLSFATTTLAQGSMVIEEQAPSPAAEGQTAPQPGQVGDTAASGDTKKPLVAIARIQDVSVPPVVPDLLPRLDERLWSVIASQKSDRCDLVRLAPRRAPCERECAIEEAKGIGAKYVVWTQIRGFDGQAAIVAIVTTVDDGKIVLTRTSNFSDVELGVGSVALDVAEAMAPAEPRAPHPAERPSSGNPAAGMQRSEVSPSPAEMSPAYAVQPVQTPGSFALKEQASLGADRSAESRKVFAFGARMGIGLTSAFGNAFDVVEHSPAFAFQGALDFHFFVSRFAAVTIGMEIGNRGMRGESETTGGELVEAEDTIVYLDVPFGLQLNVHGFRLGTGLALAVALHGETSPVDDSENVSSLTWGSDEWSIVRRCNLGWKGIIGWISDRRRIAFTLDLEATVHLLSDLKPEAFEGADTEHEGRYFSVLVNAGVAVITFK